MTLFRWHQKGLLHTTLVSSAREFRIATFLDNFIPLYEYKGLVGVENTSSELFLLSFSPLPPEHDIENIKKFWYWLKYFRECYNLTDSKSEQSNQMKMILKNGLKNRMWNKKNKWIRQLLSYWLLVKPNQTTVLVNIPCIYLWREILLQQEEKNTAAASLREILWPHILTFFFQWPQSNES